jgi:hypothetical protein
MMRKRNETVTNIQQEYPLKAEAIFLSKGDLASHGFGSLTLGGRRAIDLTYTLIVLC